MKTQSIPDFLQAPAKASAPEVLNEATRRRVCEWILYDVGRQGVMPERVLRLRGYYYFQTGINPALAGIPDLWPALHDGVEEVVRSGHLAAKIINGARWVHLPGATLAGVTEGLRRKIPVYEAWKKACGAAGPNGNNLVRAAFMDAGFTVAEKPVRVAARGKQVIEIDVYTLAPFRIGVEVKNALSEIYCDPSIMASRNHKDYRQIVGHFDVCAKLGITPALVASRIDPSFSTFAKAYGGLAKSMLFQFLPAGNESLCERISQELGFGNVRVAHRGSFGVVGREAVRVQRTLSNWIRSMTYQVADVAVLNQPAES